VLEIERTGYYAWLGRKDARKEDEKRIKEKILKEFWKAGGAYGVDRIVGKLRETGEHIGYHKCRQYMKELGLSSVHNRHKTRSLTNSKKARGDEYLNLLRRERPIVPRYALSSDITYLRTDEGFDYLCTIRDIVTGETNYMKSSD
jgi:hypothetical protein